MAGSDIPIPPELDSKLIQFNRHLRQLALLRGLGIVVLVGSGAVAVGLLTDAWWNAGSVVRWALFLGVGLLIVYAIWKSLLRPHWRSIDSAQLASLLDAAHPSVAERLSSTVEVCRDGSPEISSSNFLRERLAREAVAETGRLEFARTISAKSALRWIAVGGLATVLLLAPFAVSPAGYGLLWARLFIPWGNFETAGNLQFRLAEGDRVVTRGSDVLVQAELVARHTALEAAQIVHLTWRDSSGKPHTRRMTFSENSATYEITLAHVLDSFEFSLSAGDHRSKNYTVTVVEAPQLTELTLQITPPTYTRLPPRELDGALGEIEVLEQSRLVFEARFNKQIRQAELHWSQSPGAAVEALPGPVAFAISEDARSATLDMTATSGGPFALRMRDRHEFEAVADQPRVLVVVRDQPPQLLLEYQSDAQRKVSPYGTLPIRVTATDDFGVDSLELHYETTDEQAGVLRAAADAVSRTAIQHKFEITPAELGLADGSTLSYRIRVTDAREVPGPNEVWSDPQTILIDANADALAEAELARQQQAFREALQTLRERVAHSRDEVDALQREFQPDAEVESAGSTKQNLARLSAELANLSGGTEQLASTFEEFPLYSDLTDDLRKVARERLGPAREKLGAAASEPPVLKNDTLAESRDHLTEAEKQFLDIEGRFEELIGIENDLLELNRLARAASQLVSEARDLQQLENAAAQNDSDQSTAADNGLDERYEELQNQQQTLSEDLDDLLERRPELIEAALGEIRDRLLTISRELKEIARPQLLMNETLREQVRQAEQQEEQTAPAESAETPQSDPQLTAKKALATQQQIAGDLARVAVEVAESLGADSPAAQLALKWVQSGAQSSESVMTGQFERAAREGQQTSTLARRLAQELRRLERDEDASDLMPKVRTLLQRQVDMNKELLRISDSGPTQLAARVMGQTQLIRATELLGSQLKDVGEQLSNPPFDERVATEKIDTAIHAAQRSKGLMYYVQKHQRQKENKPAARKALSANRFLLLSASSAEAAAEALDPQNSPVPGEVGEQVTQAAQQLADAQEHLAQSRASSGQQSNQSGDNQEAAQPGQQQSAGENEQSGQQGQGESSQQSAASDLEQAANSLAQAAQGMQKNGGRQGPPGRQSGNANQSDHVSESPGDAATAGGTGARATVDLRELESQLKKQLSRNWGRLPGTLQTEILQSARKTPRGDYARLIKLYFEEIAKPQAVGR